MATVDHAARPQGRPLEDTAGINVLIFCEDRHTRRRPFASWMKRLANLKSSSSDSTNGSSKKGSPSKSKKSIIKNNPYPESGYMHRQSATNGNRSLSVSSPILRSNRSYTSVDEDDSSFRQRIPTGNKSAAPTVATNPETINSDTAQSKAGTANTVAGVSFNEGGNSTFSSPNHSERSLTTTLTTIQSTAASGLLGQGHTGGHHNQAGPSNQVTFSHQFPTSPASALPPHMNPQSYHTATANNILTDNASILTLASSSKRRRRNSMDTDASVRALAPSSLWGGSRESLPLSVLSSTVEAGPSGSIYQGPSRPSIGGSHANAERASVYSSSGVAAPALPGERSSYYSKTLDGASVRSGLLGHGRAESISGSIAGIQNASPLTSPREATMSSRVSRRSSEWRDERENPSDDEDERERRIDGEKEGSKK